MEVPLFEQPLKLFPSSLENDPVPFPDASRNNKEMVALDISALMWQPVTGIQRVILEVVPRFARLCFAQGVSVSLVHSVGSRLWTLCEWNEPVSTAEVAEALSHFVESHLRPRDRWIVDTLRRCRGVCRQIPGVGKLADGIPGVTAATRWAVNRLFDFLAWRNHSRTRRPVTALKYYVNFATGLLPVALSARLHPSTILLVVHDLLPLKAPACFPKEMRRDFLLNLYDYSCFLNRIGAMVRFVTVSHQVAGDLRNLLDLLGNPSVPVQTIHNGYAREKFFPDFDQNFRQSMGIPAESKVVLAVGTREPRKRFGDVEEAIRRLAELRDVHGVFVGRRHPHQGHPRLHYLGYVDDAGLRRAYSSCDVYVNWSAFEGFGLPLLEALACGAPVVIPPDNYTLREVGGRAVRIADHPTVEGLVNALREFLDCSAGRQPRIDLSRYDWDLVAHAYAQALFGNSEELHAAA